MRSRLLLVPIAAVVACPAAQAAETQTYMSIEQAQARLFPGATLRPDFLFLSEAQYQALQRAAGVTQWVREIKAWRASTGGWFLIDQVAGRNDMITYALAITPDGVIRGMEILSCLEGWAQIRNPAWLRQFIGAQKLRYDADAIRNISGTTLSAQHLAEGMKRVLIIHETLLKSRR